MAEERPSAGRERSVLVVAYDESSAETREVADLGPALDLIGGRRVTWIMIRGQLEGQDLEALRERLGLHPVMVDELSEDEPGRPKLIDYHDIMLVSWKLLDLQGVEMVRKRAAVLLGRGFLISIVPHDRGYKEVVGSLRGERNQLRSMGPDYLLYEIIDRTVDEYFDLSEELGDLIDDTQDRILEGEGRDAMVRIQQLRRALIELRKAIWPLREAVNTLVKGHSDLIEDYTAPYFRDVYDHTIELMDTVDTHRDMIAEMMDIYQSEVSNQLNQIVKVLTLISVIFAPLTFIVGWYGMNFRHMPELGSTVGYPAVLVLMLIIALAMVVLFRRKGWF